MKTVSIFLTLALVLGLMAPAQAAEEGGNPALVKAEAMAKMSVAKVLAVKENDKAAETLTAEIRAMIQDENNEAEKAGAPELTIALLVKTDPDRALQILPIVFLSLTEGVKLDLYQRLVASALIASGDMASTMTEAILAGLSGKNRWIEVVMMVAKDTPRPLPIALRTAIQALPATVLPPAVIPPGPYQGQ